MAARPAVGEAVTRAAEDQRRDEQDRNDRGEEVARIQEVEPGEGQDRRDGDRERGERGEPSRRVTLAVDLVFPIVRRSAAEEDPGGQSQQ